MDQYISIKDENGENKIVPKSTVDLTNYEQKEDVWDTIHLIERWEYKAS